MASHPSVPAHRPDLGGTSHGELCTGVACPVVRSRREVLDGEMVVSLEWGGTWVGGAQKNARPVVRSRREVSDGETVLLLE